jgi:hypothetical protein
LVFLARHRPGKVGGSDNGFFLRQEAAMRTPYPPDVEQAMLVTYASLNERQRRLYAANEALKLGHGGVGFVARLFDCHRKTVQRGLADLRSGASSLPPSRARKKGVADDVAWPCGPDSTKPS